MNHNMAKKIKKVTKKKSTKKVSKKVVKGKSGSVKSKQINSNKQKIDLVLKNLVLFAILSLASFLLYRVSSDELLINLFYLLAMVLGFVAGAFFIVLLVFFFMKIMNK